MGGSTCKEKEKDAEKAGCNRGCGVRFLQKACPLLDLIQGVLVLEVPEGPQSSVEASGE